LQTQRSTEREETAKNIQFDRGADFCGLRVFAVTTLRLSWGFELAWCSTMATAIRGFPPKRISGQSSKYPVFLLPNAPLCEKILSRLVD
jgi:hypothetical protein